MNKKYAGARIAAPLFFFLFLCAACHEEQVLSADSDSFADAEGISSDEETDEGNIKNETSNENDIETFDPSDKDSPGLLDDDTPDLSGSSDETSDDDAEASPVFLSLSVVMNPNEAAPLVGIITARTEPATRLRATLESDEGIETIRYAQLATEHRLPILGLLPEHTYTVTVAAETNEGGVTLYPEPFPLVTPPLHPDFPAIQHLFHRPAAEREGGYTFVVLHGSLVDGTDPPFGFQTIAFDREGRTRWYFWDSVDSLHGVQSLPTGNLLLQFSQKIIEIDMFGDIRGEWRPEGIAGGPLAVTLPGVSRMHHAAVPTSDDTILTLDSEFRTVENFPTSDTDPDAPKDTVTVRADVIVEFERDGMIVRKRHLLDMLDPHRIGYATYPGGDWSHSNYVFSTPDDGIVLSVRNQSCLVEFDRLTGDVRWILGNHENWAPAFGQYLLSPIGSPFEWMWHQHNPKLTPQGTFLVFDNGAYRATPYDPPIPAAENWSRAVEYRVDETLMTVEQVWEWRPDGEDRIFSAILGDVLYLSQTDHVAVAFGFIAKDENGQPVREGKSANISARIFEVTHTTPVEILYEMRIEDTSASNDAWSVPSFAFRSSLYPPSMLEE